MTLLPYAAWIPAALIVSLSTSTAQTAPAAPRPAQAFVANHGQWPSPVRFQSRDGAAVTWFEARGWTLTLERPSLGAAPVTDAIDQVVGDGQAAPGSDLVDGVAVRMTFEGMSPRASVAGDKPAPGVHHYLLGDDETRWVTDVPRFHQLRYAAVWPGIDVIVREGEGLFEYDLLLAGGADLHQVVIRCAGVDDVAQRDDGSLVFTTALGNLVQSPSTTWSTDREGVRHVLPCRYVLLGDHRFGFAVDGWNGTDPLTVDPGLIWSSYLGGSGLDLARGLDVHATGVVTVAGYSYSSNYPVTGGVYQRNLSGGSDAFVTRFAANGTTLVFSTLLGGYLDDTVWKVAVDAGLQTTVVGTTRSANFPRKTAFQTQNGGGNDGWIARLNNIGKSLVFASYAGGAGNDYVQSFHFESSTGVATFGGGTTSTNFPVTANAWQSTLGGIGANSVGDAWFVQVNSAGQRLYASYLGGSDGDYTCGVDASGATITLALGTHSTNLPVVNAFQSSHGGGNPVGSSSGDVYVAQLVRGANSTSLVYGTYFGGIENEWPFGCQVDATTGIITIAGGGRSVPTTPGALNTTMAGTDGYVSRLDPTKLSAAQLVYSTYIGGSGYDNCLAMRIDDAGFAVVTGWTNSGLNNTTVFPTTPSALQTVFGGGNGTYPGDAFVARIKMDLSVQPPEDQLDYGSYVGAPASSANEMGQDVHGGNGVLTVCGWSEGGLPMANGYDPTYGGNQDGFVMRLDAPASGNDGPSSANGPGDGPDFLHVVGDGTWTARVHLPAQAGALFAMLLVNDVDTADLPLSGSHVGQALAARIGAAAVLVHIDSLDATGRATLTIDAKNLPSRSLDELTILLVVADPKSAIPVLFRLPLLRR